MDIKHALDVLNLKTNYTLEELKKSYRLNAMKHHPDKNNNSEESKTLFQKITRAYDVLGDAEKKQKYDSMHNHNLHNNSGGGGEGGENIEHLINMLFSGGGVGMGGAQRQHPQQHPQQQHPQRQHPQQQHPKPAAIVKALNITLEMAYNGVENFSINVDNETLFINIPKNINDNEVIVLFEKGNINEHGQRGDINLVFNILQHSSFKRENNDLKFEKHITLKESLCGFEFTIKHLNGKSFQIQHRENCIIQDNTIKIIPNLGMVQKNMIGNLKIVFKIDYPQKLTSEQITALSSIL